MRRQERRACSLHLVFLHLFYMDHWSWSILRHFIGDWLCLLHRVKHLVACVDFCWPGHRFIESEEIVNLLFIPIMICKTVSNRVINCRDRRIRHQLLVPLCRIQGSHTRKTIPRQLLINVLRQLIRAHQVTQAHLLGAKHFVYLSLLIHQLTVPRPLIINLIFEIFSLPRSCLPYPDTPYLKIKNSIRRCPDPRTSVNAKVIITVYKAIKYLRQHLHSWE